jgi:hypothetical protein
MGTIGKPKDTAPDPGWCAREDLNLHPLRDQILSLARLPFRHSRSRKKMTLFPTNRSPRFYQVLLQQSKSGRKVAGVAGLEPVTSAVTGQRSNQLSYTPA